MEEFPLAQRYRVLETLGEGGTGAVVRALDLATGEEIALKVVRPGPGARALAAAEFRLLASHHHPHLVRVREYVPLEDGGAAFAMDLCAGQELLAWARQRLPPPASGLDDPLWAALLLQLLETLDYLHSRGVLHLDLKPANILVEEKEAPAAGAEPGEPRLHVRLVDFGLARKAARGAEASPSGTVEYIAPERLRGEPPGPRSDLYSLGVVLHELCAGSPPFAGESAAEVVRAALDAPPPPLEGVPEPLASTISSLLEKDPRRRPPSAAALLERLFGEAATRRIEPPFASVFAGREEPLERLIDLASGCRAGAGRCAILEGVTGVGKTRLLRELEVRLQLSGARVSLSTALADDSPGDLLRRISRHLGATASRAGAEREEGLEALPGDPLAERNDEDPRLAADAGATRERIAHRFAEAVLRSARERSLVLLVDDASRADSTTRAGLEFLARAVEHDPSPPLTLVLAIEPPGEGDDPCREGGRLGELAALSRTEHLRLRGLDEEGIRAWLAELLANPEGFDDTWPRRLAESTGGSPLHLVECLRRGFELGDIERHGSSWRLRSGAEPRVPSSLREAALGRVAAVDSASRSLLGWLATLGEPVAPAELASLLQRDPRPHEAEEESLRRLREGTAPPALWVLVERRGETVDLAYSALREALSDRLGPEETRRRHGVVARWLLERSRGEARARAEALARHFHAAGEPERARPWLREASRRARLAGALAEAARWLELRLEVAADDAERIERLLEREEIWRQAGRDEERAADLAELRRLLERGGAPAQRRELLLRESLGLDARGERRAALERLEEAASIEIEDPGADARLACRRGWCRISLSELEPGLEQLAIASRIARETGDRAQEAECLQLTGIARYLQGEYEAAGEDLARALALRRALGDVHRAGSIESNLGLIQLERGLFERAEESFRGSLRTFRRIGHPRGEAVSLLNLGLVSTETGRFESALDHITRALELRRLVGDRHGEGADLGNLGAVWLEIGRAAPAVALFEQAVAIARETGNAASECINSTRLARAALELGERESASRRLEESRPALDRAGGEAPRFAVAALAARIALEEGSPEEALAEIEAPLERARASRLRARALEGLTLRARALLDAGRPLEAEEASRAAVELLEASPGRSRHAPEAWLVRHRALEECRRQGPSRGDADGALRRAWTILRELADEFQDEELRESYLRGVPRHVEIDRRHQELQRLTRLESARREQSFYDIARSIHSILELDPLLDRLLATAIESTRAEKGLVLLRDARDELTVRAARGMPRESVEDATEICQSVIEDVARGGEPVLATDATSDDRFRQRRSVISFQIRTLMCVPLEVRDQVLGAVYVDGRGASSFGVEDLEYLVSFARLAAIAVENARLLDRLEAENRDLRREVRESVRLGGLVGSSPALKSLFARVEKVAATDASVLITGETGTGKTLLARAIHESSRRRDRPFVTVDCGSLPESLLESELFGHRRGAFSGAFRDRVGLIEEADGGTLFLDEISNTSVELQAKLLRALQEGEIRRVGENRVRQVDVRFLSATNRDLARAIEAGDFREDLYWRLAVVPIDMPPLREHPEDIPRLVEHFVARSRERLGAAVEGVTGDGVRLLVGARWPGNVRELENLIEKAAILAESEWLDAEFLATLLPPSAATPFTPETNVPRPLAPAAPAPLAAAPESASRSAPLPPEATLAELDRHWRESERAWLTRLVESCGWNLSAAARKAGVRNRNTLVSRLRKHGIHRPEAE